MALEVLAEIMLDLGAPHRGRRAAAAAILKRGYLRRVSRTEAEVQHTFDASAVIAEIWAQRKANEAKQIDATPVPLLPQGVG